MGRLVFVFVGGGVRVCVGVSIRMGTIWMRMGGEEECKSDWKLLKKQDI